MCRIQAGQPGAAGKKSSAGWASIYQSRKHPGKELGRMSKHVPDIRVLIPGTSVAMTRTSTESSSYNDIWRSWTIIYRDIPIQSYDVIYFWGKYIPVYTRYENLKKVYTLIYPVYDPIWQGMGHGVIYRVYVGIGRYMSSCQDSRWCRHGSMVWAARVRFKSKSLPVLIQTWTARFCPSGTSVPTLLNLRKPGPNPQAQALFPDWVVLVACLREQKSACPTLPVN